MWSNLAAAVRSLAKRPLHAAISVATLSVGIASAVAMFAVLHAVLLRPLPVRDQDRLAFATKHPRNDRQVLPFSLDEYTALRGLASIVAGVGGAQSDGPFPIGVRVGGQTFRANITSVSRDFFTVLGARAERGQLTVGPDPETILAVAISRRLWLRRFGADPAVIGKIIQLSYPLAARIVGVAPARFDFPHGTDIWNFVRPPAGKAADYAWFSAVVRLAPNVSLDAARSAFQVVVAQRSPRDTMLVEVQPFLGAAIGNLRPTVVILSVAAGVLLLVAIGNAAGLLLVQGSARARELAIRSALGAGRSSLVRLLTAEAGLLAAGAAAIGTGLALAILRVVAALTPAEVARVNEVELNPLVLFAAVAAAGVAVLLAGILPAVLLSEGSLFGALRSGRVGADALARTSRTRETLVAVQVALAVVVAAAAGLMIRTLDNLNRLDLGVDRSQLTIVRTTPGADVETIAAAKLYYDQLAQRVAAAPGVEDATPLTSPPFVGWRGWTTHFTLPGQTPQEAARNPFVDLEVVAPNYFHTMGIGLVRGRIFDGSDRAGHPRRAIVNETLARMVWPGGDPIGQVLNPGPDGTEVVGVARDTRFRELTSAAPTLYLALDQADSVHNTLPDHLAVRSRLGAGQVAAVVRNAAKQLSSGATVYETTSMKEAIQEPLARPRFSASLLIAFATVTLLLVAAGLFATISALVQQRTREIGVRMALGARPAQVGRRILGRGLAITGIGLAAGLTTSMVGSSLIRRLLFGVQPTDPLTLISTALLAAMVAVVACLVPTLRAARIDPMQSLRSD